jgi:protein-disulfide isomerase
MNTLSRSDKRLMLTPDPATDHIHGKISAPVTLIEFGDFECPQCMQACPVVESLLTHYGDRLCFVYRHFPLREVHKHAELAAEAAEAAGGQHKFWPYHHALFSRRQHLNEKYLFRIAQEMGLEQARFKNELRDNVYLQRIQEQIRLGELLGVRATPTFFVNGELTDVSFGIQHLQPKIELAFAAAGRQA